MDELEKISKEIEEMPDATEETPVEINESSAENDAVEETPVETEESSEEKVATQEEILISEEDVACAEVVKSVERQKGFLSYLHDLVFGLAAVLVIFMLFLRVVIVSGPSMLPTLHDGDCLLLLNNVLYAKPKYGDIVVATKDSFKNGEPIIKRVIATEGQVVDIDFIAGIVYIDGEILNEPYTNTPTNIKEGMTFPLIVPAGCVFVMGDNRNDSLDSRSLEIGLIDKRELLGRVIFLVLPGEDPFTNKRDFNRFGALANG